MEGFDEELFRFGENRMVEFASNKFLVINIFYRRKFDINI